MTTYTLSPLYNVNANLPNPYGEPINDSGQFIAVNETTATYELVTPNPNGSYTATPPKWPRLSEQDFRFDRWSICRG
jgi:hypothetical protein